MADLLAKAANIGDADSARSLMNLVMQFRKVCNHPELFERADVVTPFSFSRFGRPGPLAREGDYVLLPYSTKNPIGYTIPELFYRDGGLLDIPGEDITTPSHSGNVKKCFNIWSADWMHKSLLEDGERRLLSKNGLLLTVSKPRHLFHSFEFLVYRHPKHTHFMLLPSFAGVCISLDQKQSYSMMIPITRKPDFRL